MPIKTQNRILERIATHTPITVGLLAGDLNLKIDTVRKHVAALISAGRVCIGWDGYQLELTDEETMTRQTAAIANTRAQEWK